MGMRETIYQKFTTINKNAVPMKNMLIGETVGI
jgi:hypothetical protein